MWPPYLQVCGHPISNYVATLHPIMWPPYLQLCGHPISNYVATLSPIMWPPYLQLCVHPWRHDEGTCTIGTLFVESITYLIGLYHAGPELRYFCLRAGVKKGRRIKGRRFFPAIADAVGTKLDTPVMVLPIRGVVTFFLCLSSSLSFFSFFRPHIIEKGKNLCILSFTLANPESGPAWHHIIRPLDWLVDLFGGGASRSRNLAGAIRSPSHRPRKD